MTVGNLAALFLVLLVGWFWLNTLRARELALAHARRSCERAGVQLLDQAVSLRRVSIRWTPRGLKLRRCYSFEFSEAGIERQTGNVVLLGMALEELSLIAPDTGGVTASGRFEP
jgi:hypothetical protein